jgi:hypothetical protein
VDEQRRPIPASREAAQPVHFVKELSMSIYISLRHPQDRRGPVRKPLPMVEEVTPVGPTGPTHSALESVARDAGLRMPDTIATPEMAEQTGMDIRVLRWLPLYVAALGIVTVAGLAVIATVL